MEIHITVIEIHITVMEIGVGDIEIVGVFVDNGLVGFLVG